MKFDLPPPPDFKKILHFGAIFFCVIFLLHLHRCSDQNDFVLFFSATCKTFFRLHLYCRVVEADNFNFITAQRHKQQGTQNFDLPH